VELEIPGGIMDACDPSPEVCGARELREETGFEGTGARVIGQVFCNPAIMNNVCCTVLIENCELKHEVQFDPGEDLATNLIPADQVSRFVREGRIAHSLVVAALHHYDLLRRSGG
jgi:8-oxo-dGTP pyrophosphatase MutT (NUDIX family)